MSPRGTKLFLDDLEDVDLDEPQTQKKKTDVPPTFPFYLIPTQIRSTCLFLGMGIAFVTIVIVALISPSIILRKKQSNSEIDLRNHMTQFNEPQFPGFIEEGLLICGSSVLSNTHDAFSYTLPSCGDVLIPSGKESIGHWYSFLGNGSCMKLSTCNIGTEFDTNISVYSRNRGIPEDYKCLVGNDDSNDQCSVGNNLSIVNFQTEPHELYSVFIGGFNELVGQYEFTLECLDCKPTI